jgi:hypothetical protein
MPPAISSSLVGKVDPIKTGMLDRRTRYPHMHFRCPRFTQTLHTPPGCGTTHDRIIHDNNPLPSTASRNTPASNQHRAHDPLLRHDKRSPNIVIADEAMLQRDLLSIEYPSAAEFPLSGTAITTSASTGCSFASWRPYCTRTSCTFFPNTILSGRAKYTTSKIQLAGFRSPPQQKNCYAYLSHQKQSTRPAQHPAHKLPQLDPTHKSRWPPHSHRQGDRSTRGRNP